MSHSYRMRGTNHSIKSLLERVNSHFRCTINVRLTLMHGNLFARTKKQIFSPRVDCNPFHFLTEACAACFPFLLAFIFKLQVNEKLTDLASSRNFHLFFLSISELAAPLRALLSRCEQKICSTHQFIENHVYRNGICACNSGAIKNRNYGQAQFANVHTKHNKSAILLRILVCRIVAQLVTNHFPFSFSFTPSALFTCANASLPHRHSLIQEEKNFHRIYIERVSFDLVRSGQKFRLRTAAGSTANGIDCNVVRSTAGGRCKIVMCVPALYPPFC